MTPRKDPQAGCRCDPCERLRKKVRERKYRVQRGQANRITDPRELAPLFAHIRRLAAAGLTGRVVGERTTPGCKRVFEAVRRNDPPAGVLRSTLDIMMQIEPHTTIADMPGPMSGPRTNALGSMRRLQGLAERGFTEAWMAKEARMAECTVHLILTGQQTTISRKSYGKIRLLFKTWSVREPVGRQATIRARINLSRRLGYAPSACWDDDTMDKPQSRAAGWIKEK